VDHPVLVRVLQGGCHLAGDGHRLLDGELLLPIQPLAEGIPPYVGHHEEEEAVGLPGIMEGKDVGVGQIGGCLDLGQEALRADHGGELWPENLEGHSSVVPEILGEVHRGHPARADLSLDSVAAFEGRVQAGDWLGHEKITFLWSGTRYWRLPICCR
jgi:hypothetical protein